MGETIKELVSKADKGDTEAQRELMQRGDAASEAEDHQQAAYMYKMAAMAYRINASRVLGRLLDSSRNHAEQLMTVHYYDAWIRDYTAPKAPRINELIEKKLAREASDCILSLRRDERFKGQVRYLESRLDEHGIHFCAPGGTINRHFYAMVNQRENFTGFMNGTDVRVVLDPICDEVLRMCNKP